MRHDRVPTAVTLRAWAVLLSRTLLRRSARHAARRLPRPSLAGFVARLASPEHAHCVRVQVGQLSRTSSRRIAAFARAGFALRPCYTTRRLRNALRALFARKGTAGADCWPALARRKTHIVQNGRSLRGRPRRCARVGVRHFGQVLTARLQARALVLT